MTKRLLLALLLLVAITGMNLSMATERSAPAPPGEYTLVVEGFDWGPAVSKLVLKFDTVQSTADFRDYTVYIEKNSDCVDIPAASRVGTRTVLFAYVSDHTGKRSAKNNFITLVLSIAPNMALASPFQYSVTGKCRGNNWVDYKVTVANSKANKVWSVQNGRILPLIDSFDLKGKFEYESGKSMSYASFSPISTAPKKPLIIWLHGGGEGGTDPTIPLLGNRAANYASAEIQQYFGAAYVLVPQCPGAWMHNAAGISTQGKDEDIYNKGLLALIKQYVDQHPDIDRKKIYVGGCSNGGYMALKLLLVDPTYFAAAYISALAYQSQYISDNQIKSIVNTPIWFVHSNDDSTTVASKTVIPVYNRLKENGARNVHLSLYNQVTDITGIFGGENFVYNGHWSWIYSHANLAKTEFDGSLVRISGRPVSIMEWMSVQSKK
jgi:predicted esterase